MLQHSCMLVVAVLALILVTSRLFTKWTIRNYERSRWMLVAAMFLLCVHYVLQMHYGIRAEGAYAGAVVNILFYAPVSFLVSLSLLYMECREYSVRHYVAIGAVGYLLILGAFIAGWVYYGSLHMPITMYVMLALFYVILGYFIVSPINQIRRKYRVVAANTGGDMMPYRAYIYAGFLLLALTALFATTAIVSTQMLYIAAPLVLIGLFVFVMSFVAIGFVIEPEEIELFNSESSQESEETAADAMPSTTDAPLSAAKMAQISELLKQWCSQGGFRDSSTTLASLSRRIGISRRELTIYFQLNEQCTFRVWLSNIRLSEAQRIMIVHPEYSNETVSAECGFSSRGQLYNIFHDKTGMSPKEWKEKQQIAE